MKRRHFTIAAITATFALILAFACLVPSETASAMDNAVIAETEQSYVYDGTEKVVAFSVDEASSYEYADAFVEYTGIGGTVYATSDVAPTDVGSYEAVITLNVEITRVSLTITPVLISRLDYTGVISKVYDGTADVILAGERVTKLAESDVILTGKVAGDDLFLSHTSAVYESPMAGGRNIILQDAALDGEDKGNYRLAAGNNLVPIRGQITRIEITLTPKDVTATYKAIAFTVGGKSVLDYTGIGIENIPVGERAAFVEKIELSTDVTEASEVGNYDITVEVPGVWQNYNVTLLTGTFTVVKADITGVFFNDISYPYNTKEHAVLISGNTTGLTVTYSGNKGTDAGYYNARAEIFKTKNYNTLVLNAILTINAITVSTTELNPSVSVRLKSGSIPPDVSVFISEEITESATTNLNALLVKTEDKAAEDVKKLYNMKLKRGTEDYAFADPVEISLLIPESVTVFKGLRVLLISEDGTVSEVEGVSVDEESRYATFTGSSQGIYAIVGEAVVKDDDGGNTINVQTLLIIGGVGIGLIILILLGSLGKKRKRYKKSRRKHARYA